MYLEDQRKVIFHIDDIWCSESTNRAAFALFWQWKATSGSIMVPCKSFNQISEYDLTDLDLWVHLTLTSERDNPWQKRWPTLPISEVPSLVDKDWFFWRTLDEVYAFSDIDQIYHELNNQILIAKQAWINISHIDSHMGVLLHRKLFPLYAQLAIDNNIQPFICYPKQTDTAWNRFYHCQDMIQLLRDKGFHVLTAYEPNSLYSWDDHTTHLQKRIENCSPGTTYFLIHVLDNNTCDEEKSPDYKARQNEYEDFISWSIDETIELQNIIKTSFISA